MAQARSAKKQRINEAAEKPAAVAAEDTVGIIRVEEKALADVFTCPICHERMTLPVQSQCCGKSACELCVLKWMLVVDHGEPDLQRSVTERLQLNHAYFNQVCPVACGKPDGPMRYTRSHLQDVINAIYPNQCCNADATELAAIRIIEDKLEFRQLQCKLLCLSMDCKGVPLTAMKSTTILDIVRATVAMLYENPPTHNIADSALNSVEFSQMVQSFEPHCFCISGNVTASFDECAFTRASVGASERFKASHTLVQLRLLFKHTSVYHDSVTQFSFNIVF